MLYQFFQEILLAFAIESRSLIRGRGLLRSYAAIFGILRMRNR